MKWSLNELRQAKETPIEFDTTLDLEAALKERRISSMREASRSNP